MSVEAFVPQHHEPGAEAEVDWGAARAVIDGQRVKVHLFQLRLCHSGAAFAGAFLRETQQAFLEAHADAFEYLGGVPALVRYDNLTSAVKQVLRGRRRVKTDRFVGLRSHYMFESQFTLIGLRGSPREGRDEGEVGRFRRRRLVQSRLWGASPSWTLGCWPAARPISGGRSPAAAPSVTRSRASGRCCERCPRSAR